MSAERRKPTYGAATRLARIVFELINRPFGWSFESIQRELGVSERTLLRYIAASREELVDWSGRPLLEVVKHGSERKLRLADVNRSPDSTAYEAASLYFMLTVLKFLEGTVIEEGLDALWERTFKGLSEKQRSRLADFDRKFFALAYAPKDYRKHDEQLDLILRSLIDQQRLRVDYAGILGEGKVHDFDPYTLLAHKGGLYLIGFSHLYEKIIYLSVERIRFVSWVLADGRQPECFAYPKGYHPEKHMEGMFGVYDGEATKVKILLHNAETEAFLRARTIHPSQEFERRRDGKTVLTMTVRGTTEVRNWVLNLGPWAEVLEPAHLRKEIGDLLSEAATLYSPQSRR
jgi:proteasome accessory factor B